MRRRRPEDQESSVGLPRTVTATSMTRHTHEKRLSVSPEVSLGGFLLVGGDLTAASPQSASHRTVDRPGAGNRPLASCQ